MKAQTDVLGESVQVMILRGLILLKKVAVFYTHAQKIVHFRRSFFRLPFCKKLSPREFKEFTKYAIFSRESQLKADLSQNFQVELK